MDRFLGEELPSESAPTVPTRANRVVVAQILDNAYTAVETVLLRISQDRKLPARRPLAQRSSRPDDDGEKRDPTWVISDETHRLLVELMLFISSVTT